MASENYENIKFKSLAIKEKLIANARFIELWNKEAEQEDKEALYSDRLFIQSRLINDTKEMVEIAKEVGLLLCAFDIDRKCWFISTDKPEISNFIGNMPKEVLDRIYETDGEVAYDYFCDLAKEYDVHIRRI